MSGHLRDTTSIYHTPSPWLRMQSYVARDGDCVEPMLCDGFIDWDGSVRLICDGIIVGDGDKVVFVLMFESSKL